MTDFYQWFTGRPSPGRRQRGRAFRYATSGERNTPEERAGTLDESLDTAREDGAATGARARGARGRYDGRTGPPRGPAFPVGPGGLTGEMEAVGLSQVIPSDEYGGDFVARLDDERRARLPSFLRQGADEIVDEPQGYEPRNPNNRIADAPGGAGRSFDPTQEWAAAEARAGVRWREGRQTPADVFMAVVWGNRRREERREEVAEENAAMQDEITGRRPRR